MSQPDWTAEKIEWDVGICWRTQASGVDYEFKLATREIDHPGAGTWYPLGSVSIPADHVDLRGTWNGAITSISELRQGYNPGSRAGVVFSTATVVIGNNNAAEYQNLLDFIEDSQNFSERLVKIGVFVFERGTTVDPDTDLFFLGAVEPGGAEIQADSVTLTLTDALQKNVEKSICTGSVTALSYPDMDKKYDGWTPPILFGHFDNEAPGDTAFQYMEVIIVDKTMNYFKICDPGPNGINFNLAIDDNLLYHFRAADAGGLDCEGVYHVKAGVGGSIAEFPSQSGIVAVGVAGAGAPAVVGWEEGDYYILRLYDMDGNVDGSLSVYQNPAEVWRHILIDYAGVREYNIDDSWEVVRDYLIAVGITTCRRIIKETTKIIDVLEELCSDFGLVMYTARGKWRLGLNHRVWPIGTNWEAWPGDILKGSLKGTANPDIEEYNRKIQYFYGYNNGYGLDVDHVKQIAERLSTWAAPAEWYFQPVGGETIYTFKIVDGAFGKTDLKVKFNNFFKIRTFESGGDEHMFRATEAGSPPETKTTTHGMMWVSNAVNAQALALRFYAAQSIENYSRLSFGADCAIIKRAMGPDKGLNTICAIHDPGHLLLNENIIGDIYDMAIDLTKGVSKIKIQGTDAP